MRTSWGTAYLKWKGFVVVFALLIGREVAESKDSGPNPYHPELQESIQRYITAEKQYLEAKSSNVGYQEKKKAFFREKDRLRRIFSLYRAYEVKGSFNKAGTIDSQ